jgi:hypothetical protein
MSLILCFVFALLNLLIPLQSRAAADFVEITGIVLVVDLFESYDTEAVMIAGDDGEMYAVSIDEKGMELMRHENKTVKVIGTVAINENGGKNITVERYEILKDYLDDNLRVETRNGPVSNTTTI